MRRHQHLLTITLLTIAGCADQSRISGSPADDRVSDILASPGVASAGASAEKQYRVTVENMTTGQVFSPGVIATHTKSGSVWEVGSQASEGIRKIAEDGDEATAVSELSVAPGVFEVISTLAPINRIGGPAGLPSSRTFTIGASANANRLSIAVMIICTNDGFTGISGVKLPGGFKPETHLVGAWDSGTEQNNELFSQIVDPCQMAGPVAAPPDGNGRVETIGGVIAIHPNITGLNITGVGLSVALHGWQFPVARITVQRLR
ncbi:MAG: spondin domain-containing protein [Gemmatimonadota bacterium]|nr:spondin domain-containing protein [Gemmatimonadota bacterium]